MGGVQSLARFIQNEQTRFGHLCPADQHTLAFSLRQHHPWPFCQMGALDVIEQPKRPPPLAAARPATKIYHCIFAADHGFQGLYVIRHHLPH